MKRAVILLLVVAAVGASIAIYYTRRAETEIGAVTSPIMRGDITDAVSTTGSLQAVTTVQVGSQVSGNISYLGADFNSIVKAGQVIAKLDPSLVQAQVDQTKANVTKTQADVVQAEANVTRANVVLLDAQQKYARAQGLAARQLLSPAELDSAKIAVDSAQASLQSSQAALNAARAIVGQAQANLHQAQVNLDHTIITAPVDGIVTLRNVDVGQTVAASMQAPTLFVIAADLTKLQVSANIDEADIGRIRPGQRATFRVDAYATETFEGTVSQIRLQPVVVQNVTTYATIVNAPNPDLKLRPGMTATMQIQVSRKTGVLRVPAAALRFRPSADVFAALNQPVPPAALDGGRGGRDRGARNGGSQAGVTAPPAAPATAPLSSPTRPSATSSSATPSSLTQPGANTGRGRGRGDGRGGGRGGRGRESTATTTPIVAGARSADTIDALFAPLPPVESRGRVWTFADKQLTPIEVRLGITDGTFTELLDGGALGADAQVVTGMTGITGTSAGAAAAAGNPFQQGGRGGPGGGAGRGF